MLRSFKLEIMEFASVGLVPQIVDLSVIETYNASGIKTRVFGHW